MHLQLPSQISMKSKTNIKRKARCIEPNGNLYSDPYQILSSICGNHNVHLDRNVKIAEMLRLYRRRLFPTIFIGANLLSYPSEILALRLIYNQFVECLVSPLLMLRMLTNAVANVMSACKTL